MKPCSSKESDSSDEDHRFGQEEKQDELRINSSARKPKEKIGIMEYDMASPFKDDAIVPLIEAELKSLSPTQEQLVWILSQLKVIQLKIPKDTLDEEAKIADTLLQNSEQNVNDLIKNIPNGKSKDRMKSRIMYGIGNQIANEEKWEKMKLRELTNKQIEELMSYETIELEIQNFTKEFTLKLREIQESTKNMEELFTKCFSNNQSILENESFFKLQNGIEAARFAREGCNSDKRGIYIFLNYLVRTIKKMEEDGIRLDEIEEQVTYLIGKLSQLYPPGQGLAGEDEKHKGTLGNIEKTWDKGKYPLENNPEIEFKDQKDKRKQLEEQIIKKARIAGEELPLLNEIIRQNCLKKCIGVSSNLKLYVQAKNSKALVRITEKMLFKKKKQVKQQKSQEEIKLPKKKIKHQSLQDHFKQQKESYQDEVERRLEGQQSLEFTISDMVRGKCTFSKIEDIIETIENIQEYVEKSQKVNPKKFRILEIQSRFTKPVPISDITLKIALNQRIIAQLQLTLQDNVATYAFAHKIYELQRSKAYSKITTVFNYYQEYRKEFQELVAGQIIIFSSQQLKKIAQSVKKYFEIQGNDRNVSLVNVLKDNKYESQILQKGQKLLVKAVFDRTMQKSNKERAPLFIGTLSKKSSDSSLYPQTLKSAIFYQMIKDINIPENFNEICKLHTCLVQYLNTSFLKSWEPDLDIESLKTIRSQMKYQQLDQLFKIHDQPKNLKYHQLFKRKEPFYEMYYCDELIPRLYGDNQQLCKWRIDKGKMYDHINDYEKALQQYDQALEMTDQQEEKFTRKINLNKAIVLIKTRSFMKANGILSKIKGQYKESQQYKNAAVCALLLSECALMQEKQDEFKEYYGEAKKIANMQRINYQGIEIADSEYRIGEKLIKERPEVAIDTHLRCAFEEYGAFKDPKSLLKMIEENWGKYQEWKLPKPGFKENRKIKQMKLRSELIGDQGFQHLSKANWPNLQQIWLEENKISDKGCQHLCRANWPNMRGAYLRNNQIGGKGCKHLCRAKWPKLQQILLEENQIGDQGCQNLCIAKWPNLKWIWLDSNEISDKGCLHLSKAEWPNLQQILLENNRIGDQGCQYLCRAKWPNLQKIILVHNKIGDEGCQHLSIGEWPNLQQICLSENRIGDQGCSHLSKAKWPELQTIALNYNEIGAQGCQHLCKAKWPNLQYICLQNYIPNNLMQELKGKLKQAFSTAKVQI